MNNLIILYIILFLLLSIKYKIIIKIYGDWGLGIGDWGLGIGPQSPIPNPQSPYINLY